MEGRVRAILAEVAGVHERLADLAPAIADAVQRMAGVFAGGGTVYIAGNGGSAADAQHMAGELVGRFLLAGRPPLPCLALTTDTSVLTAVGNDFGFDEVFIKQVQAFVCEGDALLAISTSGNSRNVLAAVDEANRRGALTIGLTGGDGGALSERCTMCLCVPAQGSPLIQAGHGTIVHILCELIEQKMYGEADAGGL